MNWHALIDGGERVLELAHDCVHVWRVSTALDGDLEQFTKIATDDERARAKRFHFERDRRSFLVCRSALRRVVSAYTGKRAGEIRFQIGPHGKPSLAQADTSDLRFNVSHSGEVALLAFSRKEEVGVDVEFKRADVDFAGLAEMSFSMEERDAILTCGAAERANLFYEYWTCKEASIKADGRGLSVPLDRFTVSKLEGNPNWRELISSDSSCLPPGMRSRILDVGDGYAAAVVTNIPSCQVIQFDMEPAKEHKANEFIRKFSRANPSRCSLSSCARIETGIVAGSLAACPPASVSERARP